MYLHFTPTLIQGGSVNLQKLRIKTSCLDFLRLPVSVKHGYVGTLSLSANWRALKSEAVEVLLDQVFIVVGPRGEIKVDAEAEKERAMKTKTDKLEALEKFYLSPEYQAAEKKHKSGSPGAKDPAAKKEKSFVESLKEKIMDNINIKVKNIHIRFEDAEVANGSDSVHVF